MKIWKLNLISIKETTSKKKKKIKEMSRFKITNMWQGPVRIIKSAQLKIKNIKNNKIITQFVWTRPKGNQ
jgi:hypothetical protein